jgi:hypothetical protein
MNSGTLRDIYREERHCRAKWASSLFKKSECPRWLDGLLSSLLPGTFIVATWVGWWAFLDYVLLPEASFEDGAVVSTLIGAGLAIALYSLGRWGGNSSMQSRLVSYLSALCAIFYWRGVWYLFDALTSDISDKSIFRGAQGLGLDTWSSALFSHALGLLVMLGTLSLRSAMAPPALVDVDSDPDGVGVSSWMQSLKGRLVAPELLKLQSSGTAYFVLDTVVSIGIVSTATIAWWRGSWLLLDEFLLPEDIVATGWISLAMGVFIHTASYGTRGVVIAYQQQTSTRPLASAILDRVVSYITSWGSVLQWRGSWLLLELWIARTTSSSTSVSPKWGFLTCHVAGVVGLYVLGCMRSAPAPPGIIAVDDSPWVNGWIAALHETAVSYGCRQFASSVNMSMDSIGNLPVLLERESNSRAWTTDRMSASQAGNRSARNLVQDLSL